MSARLRSRGAELTMEEARVTQYGNIGGDWQGRPTRL